MRINLYQLSHYILKIPVGLLTTKQPNVLLPVYATWFDSDSMNEYGRRMISCIEQIQLICVEVEVIKMITNGVIPKMSQEECSQLTTDLEKINLYREDAYVCVLDISRKFADHFVEDDTVARMLANRASRGDWSSDDSNVDPPCDASTDDVLFRANSDYGSIASFSSNTVMEDAANEARLIDLTNPDEKDDSNIADDDTSISLKVACKVTMSKNILNFLKEI